KDIESCWVGIRPEGFVVDKQGPLELHIDMVETIGRDTSLVIKDDKNNSRSFRVIVDSSNRILPNDKVKFSVKPSKLFLFDKVTGEKLG
ncbi:MAG: ABC transporter ATP-binding protein, partial [Firmicutes bacterium]|nr:ABC transporter ATP-binding protein [Bacillota bacterium]